jgi:hypothetical protein
MALILIELASLGATPHVGGSTNNSAQGIKSPSQLSSGGSVMHGASAPGLITSDSEPQPEDQSVAEPSPSGGEGQSSLAGLVQQTLSNAVPPVPIGPLGH